MRNKTNGLADILLLLLIVLWAAVRAVQATVTNDNTIVNMVTPSVVTALLLVLAYLAVSWLYPSGRNRALNLLAFTAVCIFCFSYIDTLFPALRYRWQLMLWAGISCAIVILQDWLNPGRSKKPITFVIVLLYLSLVPLVIAHVQRGDEKTAKASSAQIDASSPQSGFKSNVYFFMLDAYGRSDVLQSQIGYDNSAFIGGLGRLGFAVGEKSTANYPVTTLSVSSMLDMRYPIDAAENALADIENYTPIYDIINGSNASARFFQERGYNYVHFWPNGKCDYSVNICPTHQQFFDDAKTAYLGLTPLGRLIWLMESRDNRDPVKQSVQKILNVKPAAPAKEHDIQAVGRIIGQLPTDKPYFLFARILPPHPGNSYGENCQYTEAVYTVAQVDFDVPKYVADMKCVETDIMALVEKILKEDTSHPVIVVQSDHGPEVRGQLEKKIADWDAEDIIGRFGSLSAIYMQGGCVGRHHYPTISSVNTLRLVTACLSGTTPAFIPDISYFATYVGRPEHGMVIQIAKDGEPRKK